MKNSYHSCKKEQIISGKRAFDKAASEEEWKACKKNNKIGNHTKRALNLRKKQREAVREKTMAKRQVKIQQGKKHKDYKKHQDTRTR